MLIIGYISLYLITAIIGVILDLVFTMDVLNVAENICKPLKWFIQMLDCLIIAYIFPVLAIVWIGERCYKLYNERSTPNLKQERKQTHEESV